MRNRNRNRKGPNPLQRSYESNGGDVKIRGTALHVAEKYVQLARDAQSSGDRVAGENYLQHAEHYYRIVAAAQAQMPQPQQFYRNDDGEDEGEDDRDGNVGGYNGNNNVGNPYQGNRPQQGGQPQQGGGHAAYGIPVEQQQPSAYGNGNNANGNTASGGGQDQPAMDSSGQPGDDNRPQGGQNNGGNNFRGRRRRPYRDQYAGDRGGNNNAPAPVEPGGGGFDAPPSDE
jgi:hypothetical protein